MDSHPRSMARISDQHEIFERSLRQGEKLKSSLTEQDNAADANKVAAFITSLSGKTREEMLRVFSPATASKWVNRKNGAEKAKLFKNGHALVQLTGKKWVATVAWAGTVHNLGGFYVLADAQRVCDSKVNGLIVGDFEREQRLQLVRAVEEMPEGVKPVIYATASA